MPPDDAGVSTMGLPVVTRRAAVRVHAARRIRSQLGIARQRRRDADARPISTRSGVPICLDGRDAAIRFRAAHTGAVHAPAARHVRRGTPQSQTVADLTHGQS